MPQGVILEFDAGVGVDANHYNAVNKLLNIDAKSGKGDWPPGIISHAAGPTEDGGFVVSEVWESQDAQGKFMEGRLGAALQEAGVPAPSQVTWFDVIGYQTPG